VCSPGRKGHDDLTSSPPSSSLSLAVSFEFPAVIEEAIFEADEGESFTVLGQSRTISPLPNVVEIPNKKEKGRLLARRSTRHEAFTAGNKTIRWLEHNGKGH